MSEIVLVGAKEIGAAIGENPKEIKRLVVEEGLPAFRRKSKGTWKAIPDDLRVWVKGQRNKYKVG